MKLSSHTPHKKGRIEVIPLIDIMFFLLASFMLVSMSMIKLQSIQTNLPKASTGHNEAKPDFVAIGIDKTGAVYFDRDKLPIDPEDLPKRLQPFYAEKQQELKVFINADQDASYNQLVTVLDKVRTLGITKVSFAVKSNNTFDPDKPRLNTHPNTNPGAPGAPADPAAPVAPAAPTAAAPPANP